MMVEGFGDHITLLKNENDSCRYHNIQVQRKFLYIMDIGYIEEMTETHLWLYEALPVSSHSWPLGHLPPL